MTDENSAHRAAHRRMHEHLSKVEQHRLAAQAAVAAHLAVANSPPPVQPQPPPPETTP